jgi:hypothetical protein
MLRYMLHILSSGIFYLFPYHTLHVYLQQFVTYCYEMEKLSNPQNLILIKATFFKALVIFKGRMLATTNAACTPQWLNVRYN